MVSPRFHPKVGGIETHMAEIGRRAIERGHDVTVHCLAHDRDLPSTGEVDGIEIRRYDPAIRLGYYTTLFRPELPDDAVVHLHAFGHRTNRWVIDHHPTERIMLTTHHGIDFPTIPVIGDLYYELYRRRTIPWLGDLHRVITMNSIDRERIVERGVPADRVVVVPSGIEEEAFDEPEVDPGPDRFVFYLGRIHREKGLEDLIRIAPELDVPVLLAGPDDGDRDRLEELAERLGVAERVRFLGLVDEEVKRGLFRNATVFALPSRHEGLGLVLLEAWAQGTPVVSTATDGPRDLVREDRDGHLVPIGDREALSDRLQALVDDPERAAEMGRAGRDRTWDEYRWPVLADRVVDMYEEVP